MRAVPPRAFVVFVVLLTSFLAPQLRAQFVWTGTSTNNGLVTDPLNWGGIAPAGTGSETLTFGVTVLQTTILFPTSSFGDITFLSTRPTFAVSGSGVSPALTLNGNVTVQAGSTINFAAGLALVLAVGDHVFDIGSATTLQLNGPISGGGHLSKIGTGTLTLTNSGNTFNYTGGLGFTNSTAIHFGTIVVNGGRIDHVGTGDVTVGDVGGDSGSLIILGGGTVNDYFGVLGQSLGSTGAASVSGGGSVWNNSAGINVGYAGNGSLTISGGGVVNVVGAASSIAQGSGSTSSAVVDGAASLFAVLGPLEVGYGGTGGLTLSNGGMVAVNSGLGTVSLGGSGTGIGTLNIGARSVQVAASGGIVNAATITTGTGSGILQFNTTATAASPYYLTKDKTVSGAAITVAGNTQVVNTAGYNVFTGASSYAGNTTVNGGTLVAGNNTAFGSSSVTVNGGTLSVASGISLSNPLAFGASGGTLAGNGTFASAVTVGTNAHIAPGSSPGLLTFSSGLTFASGGSLDIEVQSAVGAPGVGYDEVAVSGSPLNITATSGSKFNINLISLTGSGTAGPVADFLSSSSYSWLIVSSPSGITGFSASNFNIVTTGFTNSLGGGSFSISQVGTDLKLNFTAVPEPSTAALTALGLACIGLTTYRRRKAGRAASA